MCTWIEQIITESVIKVSFWTEYKNNAWKTFSLDRTSSNTSLNKYSNEGGKSSSQDFLSSSELEGKEQRRKSITKRFRKKASSVDIGFIFNDKIGE